MPSDSLSILCKSKFMNHAYVKSLLFVFSLWKTELGFFLNDLADIYSTKFKLL